MEWVGACEEKNWVAGDGVRGHGTDVTGYFFLYPLTCEPRDFKNNLKI